MDARAKTMLSLALDQIWDDITRTGFAPSDPAPAEHSLSQARTAILFAFYRGYDVDGAFEAAVRAAKSQLDAETPAHTLRGPTAQVREVERARSVVNSLDKSRDGDRFVRAFAHVDRIADVAFARASGDESMLFPSA